MARERNVVEAHHGQVPRDGQARAPRGVEDADRQGVGRRDDRGRGGIEGHELRERPLAAIGGVHRLADRPSLEAAEAVAHVLLERRGALADVAQRPAAHERDPLVAEAGEVVQGGADPGAVVDVDGRHLERVRPLPQGDHRDHRVLQVREEPGLVLHVAEQDDRVAVAGLEHRRERERLVRPAVGVPQHHVVAVAHRLDRERLDRAGEERVGDVADDRAQQHRRGPAQPAGQRVGAVAQLTGGAEDALPGLRGDRDAGRCVVEDARDGALRHAGHRRDVAHPGDSPRRRGVRRGPAVARAGVR